MQLLFLVCLILGPFRGLSYGANPVRIDSERGEADQESERQDRENQLLSLAKGATTSEKVKELIGDLSNFITERYRDLLSKNQETGGYQFGFGRMTYMQLVSSTNGPTEIRKLRSFLELNKTLASVVSAIPYKNIGSSLKEFLSNRTFDPNATLPNVVFIPAFEALLSLYITEETFSGNLVISGGLENPSQQIQRLLKILRVDDQNPNRRSEKIKGHLSGYFSSFFDQPQDFPLPLLESPFSTENYLNLLSRGLSPQAIEKLSQLFFWIDPNSFGRAQIDHDKIRKIHTLRPLISLVTASALGLMTALTSVFPSLHFGFLDNWPSIVQLGLPITLTLGLGTVAYLNFQRLQREKDTAELMIKEFSDRTLSGFVRKLKSEMIRCSLALGPSRLNLPQSTWKSDD